MSGLRDWFMYPLQSWHPEPVRGRILTMNRVSFWLMFLILVPSSWGLTLWGTDITGFEIQSSYLSIINSVGDGAPDPFVNTLGVSVPVRFLDRWVFRPEVQLFLLGYKFQDGRAVPESSIWPNVTVLSLLINPTVGYEFPLGPTLAWVAEGGLGFMARFPVFANGEGASDYALPVVGWLLAGRFLYPNVGAGLTWHFSPLLAGTLRFQAFYPIFNLWGGLPWYDEFTYGAGLGIRFTF